jgi:hypothetical protein
MFAITLLWEIVSSDMTCITPNFCGSTLHLWCVNTETFHVLYKIMSEMLIFPSVYICDTFHENKYTQLFHGSVSVGQK